MEGSVIQDAETVEFKDGLRVGVELKVKFDPYSDLGKLLLMNS